MQEKPKLIIAAVAAIIVLVVGYKLIFPSGPNKEEQRIAIERALMHDEGLASQARQEAGIWGALFGDPDTIRKYVAKLRQVPLENCPADFVKAYKAHIAAWESGNEDAIKRTWDQVVYIAYEHGVEAK